MSYSWVSLRMTSSHLAKYSMTWGIMRLLRDSWTSCTKHQSYIGRVHEKTIQRDIDNIIVDVKTMSCSEPTDSFIVNVTVAQLPGHSRGTGFYSRPGARAPAAPSPWRRHCCRTLRSAFNTEKNICELTPTRPTVTIWHIHVCHSNTHPDDKLPAPGKELCAM